ncbi:hypothetical protein C0J52_10416 [Blattella germanica]|nr:hypothetical protein C0J52_10416 [Blattella germanica]
MPLAVIVVLIGVVANADHHVEEHQHAHPKYEFKYGVKDTHTHDIKEQAEKRDGHKVEGHYKVHEADGTIRTVHYNADKHTGFHAHVERSGHATHPIHHHEKKVEMHHKKEESAPDHKFTASKILPIESEYTAHWSAHIIVPTNDYFSRTSRRCRFAIVAVLLVVAALADHHAEEHHSHPKYEFKYGVKDTHTHDIKEQAEKRDGHKVEGHYMLHEADGTIRTVHYNADKHTGFHAHVHRSGHATHPIHHEMKVEVDHKKEEAPMEHKFTASSYSYNHLH